MPSSALSEYYGRSAQTFSMCNIAPQTAALNECSWRHLEKVVHCVGKHYRTLVFAGAGGSAEPNNRLSQVAESGRRPSAVAS